MIQVHQARIIAGTQEQVKAQLDDFIATFEVDEGVSSTAYSRY